MVVSIIVAKRFHSFRSEIAQWLIMKLTRFVLKFKNLLFAGNNANLTIKSEAGKCLVNLSVEVDITLQPSGPQIYQHRHIGPARQRRHARREAARIADEAIAVVEVRNS